MTISQVLVVLDAATQTSSWESASMWTQFVAEPDGFMTTLSKDARCETSVTVLSVSSVMVQLSAIGWARFDKTWLRAWQLASVQWLQTCGWLLGTRLSLLSLGTEMVQVFVAPG